MKIHLLFVLMLNVFNQLFSQHEKLDSSFGFNGIVETCPLTPFKDEYWSRSLHIDKEEQILVFGFSTYGGYNYPMAVMFSKDGALEHQFNNNIKSNESWTKNCRTYSADVLESGTIVFGGGYLLKSGVLLQYNKDGTLDTGFGDKGRVFTDILSGDESVHQVVYQHDEKILVRGSGKHNNKNTNFLCRYLSIGKIDSSFGNHGFLLFDDSSPLTNIHIVLYLKNKHILIVGSTMQLGTDNIASLNLDGSFDHNFGKLGITEFKTDTTRNGTRALAEDSDNNILLSGTSYYGSPSATSSRAYLIKFLKNGLLDVSFGKNGYVYPLKSQYESIHDITPLQNGDIIITGHEGINTGIDIVMKLRKNGEIESTFGKNGFLVSNSGGESAAIACKVQRDCKLIFLASAYNENLIVPCIYLYRYTCDGFVNSSTEIKKQVSIYPNVVQNELILDCDDCKKEYDYTVFNNYGQRISIGLMTSNKSLDCRDLAKGIYYLVLKDKKGIILSDQFIKF